MINWNTSKNWPRRNWDSAYTQLNGLSMTEMLTGLDQIGSSLLDDLDAQAAHHARGLNMPRMQYAIEVIQTRKLPAKAPGDLEKTGQVQAARKYLAQHAGKAISQHRLRITFFWTKKARTETISSKLIDKAQELLESNGNEYILDVSPCRGLLATDKEQWEGGGDQSCKDNDEFMELYSLVKKSSLFSAGRLPVIFYQSMQTLGPYGEVNEPLQHGCGCHVEKGKSLVLINVRKQAADHVTLLHEIGHAAGLKHDGDEDNFMYGFPSKNTNRTKMNQIQRKKLGKCYFCS